ncbi:MAG: LPS assembly protein LptD [Xanthomonadales bacterium]|nr:LPS-assembly protein LptD [Xanthomonadales bacterium]MCC6594452.1 LPS assembly protein LptD [Xanthomonadales bacterium]
MKRKRSPRCLLLGLALSPLSAALAADLCPADPWHCVREGDGWRCSGQPQALASSEVDSTARAAAATTLAGERLTGTDGESVRIDGAASAVRADQSLRADRIEYDIASDTARASGNVRYDDARNAFYANEASADLGKDRTELADVRYALKSRRGQGRADAVRTEGGERTSLEGVTYTACPGDDPDWQIEARTLDIDHEAGQATARGFKVRVGGVPILYSPYASFPIDDRRKSGFLAPKIGGGSDGFDFAAPYYWNLAPNYDATLVPRLIGDRGFQAGGEFRYLYSGGHGQLDGEWLPDDDRYGEDRDRFRFRHNGRLLPGVRLDADLNRVSDDRYFVDLGDSLNTSATSVLGSLAQLSGGGRGWRWSVLADEYELILPDVDERLQHDPYERMPRAHFAIDQRWRGLRYGGAAEWVDFRREDLCVLAGDHRVCTPVVEGNRLDLAPYLGYAWEPSWGFLRLRGTLRHTRYDLDGSLVGDDAPSRTTPIFSADGGLLFERANAFGRSDWRQTLEPRLYYLRVPEREQSALPVFDTALLDYSYAQLFRENRYTGADRQSDANQLTLALSSRILGADSGVERAAFSIGQVHYFDAPEVFLPGDPDPLLAPGRKRSALVLELRSALGHDWTLSGGYRHDPERDRSEFGALRLQKRFGDEGLLNIGYRYRPDQMVYAPASGGGDFFLGRLGIEQSDVSALLPVHRNWRAVFRWNYSLRERTTLEAIAGFEYRSCCYSVRLLSRNYLRGIGTERRNAIFLELELTGLGSLGRDTGDFLRRAILGYQPFGGLSNDP